MPKPLVAADLDPGQPLRVGHRQAAQADGIQQLEYGRVGADAEGQRGDGGERESRRLSQHPPRVLQVVDRAFDEVGAPRITAFLLNLRDASQSPQRGRLGRASASSRD